MAHLFGQDFPGLLRSSLSTRLDFPGLCSLPTGQDYYQIGAVDSS